MESFLFFLFIVLLLYFLIHSPKNKEEEKLDDTSIEESKKKMMSKELATKTKKKFSTLRQPVSSFLPTPHSNTTTTYSSSQVDAETSKSGLARKEKEALKEPQNGKRKLQIRATSLKEALILKEILEKKNF